MSIFGDRARFAVLVAVGIALVAVGIAIRPVEGQFLIGVDNNARLLDTTLRASTNGAAIRVIQEGAGAGIRASADGDAAAAGWFTSVLGTGVVALTSDELSFAVDAANDGTRVGNGGAIRADGGQNSGVVAVSAAGSAVVATVSGAAPAVVANATRSTAIRAAGPGGADFQDCVVATPCAGMESTGAIGVMAGTATAGGSGVYAADQTPDRSGYAVITDGDAIVDGALSITEGCLGCTSLVVARNGSDVLIRQGDAVTVLGLDSIDGETVILVGLASRGDAILGVADRAISRTDPAPVAAGRGSWRVWGPEAAAGEGLRVATGGLLTLETGGLAGVSPGDAVTIGSRPGRMVVAARGDARVGTYLGVRPDGKGVLLIDPD